MGTVIRLQVAPRNSVPPMASVLGSAFAALYLYFIPRERRQQGEARVAAPTAQRPNLTVAAGRVRTRTLGHA